MVIARAMSEFAKTTMGNKYAHSKGDGQKETWPEIAYRVAKEVVGPYLPELIGPIAQLIEERKFIPGGRYLYAAGRRYPQVNNCFLFRTVDSREGWGNILNKSAQSLMTGGGIGIVYSDLREEGAKVHGMGGKSTGPCALMQIINEAGRHIMQGGSRRSAIWAGLHWNHPDIFKFIRLKRWSQFYEDGKKTDFNNPAPLDGTNISVILDTAFFDAYDDADHSKHSLAWDVYWRTIESGCETGDPGFSIDCDDNEGENARNAPIHGNTRVLTKDGYMLVKDIVGIPTTVWTGLGWADDVIFKKTGEMVPTVCVKMTGGREIICDPSHPFLIENYTGAGKTRRVSSVERIPASELQEGDIPSVILPKDGKYEKNATTYTLGFIYGDGSFANRGNAELTLCTEAKIKCRSEIDNRLISSESTTDKGYLRIYFKASQLFKGRSKAEIPTDISPSGIPSFIAGVFDSDGNVDVTQKPTIRMSSIHKTFVDGLARMLETVGIMAHVSDGGRGGKDSFSNAQVYQLVVAASSVRRFMQIIPTVRIRCDVSEYIPYRDSCIKVISVTPDRDADVYCADVKREEHCFMAEGVLISNCTEVTSRDDEDMCNLGSVNLAQIDSEDDMRYVTELGTIFLVCGTLYSKLPLDTMYKVREKNRRIGLGLMGLHEWLIVRGKKYGPDADLGRLLDVYRQSGAYANRICDKFSISRPVATRAIAPTGTISIVAETSSGCEPLFAVAYKRAYLKGKSDWRYQYVIDPTAKRLIDEGIDPDKIEDALLLSSDVDRRVSFQQWLQTYVDHGISSTINIPSWNSEHNNLSTVKKFGDTLMNHLRGLRGITMYPDGARQGQPLVRVPYSEAYGHEGVEYEYAPDEQCKSGICGM